MNLKKFFYQCVFLSLLISISTSSCKIMQPTMNNVLENGDYILNSTSHQSNKYYLDNHNDVIVLSNYNHDSKDLVFPSEIENDIKAIFLRQKNLIDIDLITTPVKFRPTQNLMNPQLNSAVNASLYFGLRNNYNSISYKKSYYNYKRYISSYGISYGIFAGISNASINPWVTNELVTNEYEGVVFTKGITSILGLSKFTVGLSCGFDNLLDPNRKKWIYEGKPWLGISLGLNIN